MDNSITNNSGIGNAEPATGAANAEAAAGTEPEGTGTASLEPVKKEVTRKDLQEAADMALVSIMKAGQSYKLGSRRLDRVDFKEVRSFKNDLDAAEAAETNNGFFDNCYVASFDTR